MRNRKFQTALTERLDALGRIEQRIKSADVREVLVIDKLLTTERSRYGKPTAVDDVLDDLVGHRVCLV